MDPNDGVASAMKPVSAALEAAARAAVVPGVVDQMERLGAFSDASLKSSMPGVSDMVTAMVADAASPPLRSAMLGWSGSSIGKAMIDQQGFGSRIAESVSSPLRSSLLEWSGSSIGKAMIDRQGFGSRIADMAAQTYSPLFEPKDLLGSVAATNLALNTGIGRSIGAYARSKVFLEQRSLFRVSLQASMGSAIPRMTDPLENIKFGLADSMRVRLGLAELRQGYLMDAGAAGVFGKAQDVLRESPRIQQAFESTLRALDEPSALGRPYAGVNRAAAELEAALEDDPDMDVRLATAGAVVAETAEISDELLLDLSSVIGLRDRIRSARVSGLGIILGMTVGGVRFVTGLASAEPMPSNLYSSVQEGAGIYFWAAAAKLYRASRDEE